MLRRGATVVDVHEDYAALLRDRAWAHGIVGLGGRAVAAASSTLARHADLTVVADEHLPPLQARHRLVVRNLPDLSCAARRRGARDPRPRALYVGDVRALPRPADDARRDRGGTGSGPSTSSGPVAAADDQDWLDDWTRRSPGGRPGADARAARAAGRPGRSPTARGSAWCCSSETPAFVEPSRPRCTSTWPAASPCWPRRCHAPPSCSGRAAPGVVVRDARRGGRRAERLVRPIPTRSTAAATAARAWSARAPGRRARRTTSWPMSSPGCCRLRPADAGREEGAGRGSTGAALGRRRRAGQPRRRHGGVAPRAGARGRRRRRGVRDRARRVHRSRGAHGRPLQGPELRAGVRAGRARGRRVRRARGRVHQRPLPTRGRPRRVAEDRRRLGRGRA